MESVSSIVSGETRAIFPPCPIFIACSGKTEGSSRRMVPVSLIVFGLVSGLGPVRDLVMMPTEGFKIVENSDILFLHDFFTHRKILPLFRIEAVLEEVNTGMRDKGKSHMEFLYISERFSRIWERESDNEVDVYRDSLSCTSVYFSWLKSIKSSRRVKKLVRFAFQTLSLVVLRNFWPLRLPICILSSTVFERFSYKLKRMKNTFSITPRYSFEGSVIETLDAQWDTIEAKRKDSHYIFISNIFRITFDSEFWTGRVEC